jgi:hypothetical protein
MSESTGKVMMTLISAGTEHRDLTRELLAEMTREEMEVLIGSFVGLTRGMLRTSAIDAGASFEFVLASLGRTVARREDG